MSVTQSEIKELLDDLASLEFDDPADQVTAEELMNEREFLLDVFSDMMEGDEDNQVEQEDKDGHEVEEQVGNEAREMDDVIMNIVDDSQELKYKALDIQGVDESVFQDVDGDGRVLTAEDMDKATDVLNQLEAAAMGLPTVEDRKQLQVYVQSANNIMNDHRRKIAELDDYHFGIQKGMGVSRDTYDQLVDLGIGMESHLPARDHYTFQHSTVNYSATLEAIDAKKGALVAIATITGLGLIFKIFKWIKEKFFGKKLKDTADSAEKAADEAVKLQEKNLEYGDFTVPREVIEKIEWGGEGMNIEGESVKISDVRSAVITKTMGESAEAIKNAVAGRSLDDAQRFIVLFNDSARKLILSVYDQIKNIDDYIATNGKIELVAGGGDIATNKEGVGILGRFFPKKPEIEVSTDKLATQIYQMASFVISKHDEDLNREVNKVLKDVHQTISKHKEHIKNLPQDKQQVVKQKVDELTETSKLLTQGLADYGKLVMAIGKGSKAVLKAEQEVAKFIAATK